MPKLIGRDLGAHDLLISLSDLRISDSLFAATYVRSGVQ